MTRLVVGNDLFLLWCNDLGFLFQSPHDSVDGIQEILFAHMLVAFAGRNQCCFVTHIGNISPRETWRLLAQ